MQKQHNRKISIHVLREEGDPQPDADGELRHHFYPRPPRGGRLTPFVLLLAILTFLSTSSARRATALPVSCIFPSWNFYPRPPRGGRQCLLSASITAMLFLSTSSARRATTHKEANYGKRVYFYPRPPRGGRHLHHSHCHWCGNISIHVLREEGDFAESHFLGIRHISIHVLREEGDRNTCTYIHLVAEFLSTSSARRATQTESRWTLTHPNFYPRPPRGGRRRRTSRHPDQRYFYPRPPRGGRLPRFRVDAQLLQFLSTSSARRATCAG